MLTKSIDLLVVIPHNGKIDVPSVLLEPVTVDRSNLAATVAADGFHPLEDIYRYVPKSEWPEIGGKN